MRAMNHALVRTHQSVSSVHSSAMNLSGQEDRQGWSIKSMKDVMYWLMAACGHSFIVMVHDMRICDITLSVSKLGFT